MTLKEQAEALGINTVDEDGKAIHHKTLEKLVKAASEPEVKEPEAPKAEESTELNKDGLKAGQTLSSEELLKFMAEQRKKTGKLNPYAKVKKPRQRKAKTRSKIHANAADK